MLLAESVVANEGTELVHLRYYFAKHTPNRLERPTTLRAWEPRLISAEPGLSGQNRLVRLQVSSSGTPSVS